MTLSAAFFAIKSMYALLLVFAPLAMCARFDGNRKTAQKNKAKGRRSSRRRGGRKHSVKGMIESRNAKATRSRPVSLSPREQVILTDYFMKRDGIKSFSTFPL